METAALSQMIEKLGLVRDNEKFSKARESLEPIVLQTRNVGLMCQLGTVYRKRERWQDAENLLQQARKLEPSQPEPYRSLGLVFLNRDDLPSEQSLKRAKELFSESIRLETLDNERFPATHTQLGYTYSSLGELQLAEREFRIALELDPLYEEAYFNLALLKIDEDQAEAARLLEKANGDHLGTSRLMTTVNGYPVWQATYLPFGHEYNAMIGVNNYKFTGKERDGESGLDYFGARYYASNFGRFVTPDEPLLDQEEEDPQSWNLYTYVRNNPVINSDPTGTTCQTNSSDNGGSDVYDDGDGQGCDAVDEEDEPYRPNGDQPSEQASAVVTPTYTDEERLQVLGSYMEDFRSPSSISEVGINGIMGAQAAEGVGSLPGLFRDARSAVAAWKMSAKMAGVRAAGLAGEALAGIAKNTEAIPSVTGASYRIPDVLNHGAKLIGEVKNTPFKVSYTAQIRDFVKYAETNGYQFVLYVRTSTTFTAQLQRLIDSGAVTVARF